MLVERYVAVDLETTGGDPAADRIIEIGAVVFEHGQEVAARSWLTDPGRPIPLRFQQLTGITPADVAGRPPAEAVLPEFLALVGGSPVVAHNAAFDGAFLAAALRRAGLPALPPLLDTVQLARLAFPLARSFRLGALAEELGVGLPRAHRAVDDARACGRIAALCLDRIEAMELAVLDDLGRLAPPANALSRLLEKARARRQAAGEAPRDRRAWIPPAAVPLHGPEDEEEPEAPPALDPGEVDAVLGPGGAVASAFAVRSGRPYEHRPQQLELARRVVTALGRGQVLVAEAGTGTGKSLAYLVPALLWAKRGGGRVVVSTHTITLQEQLWERDLPFLLRALGWEDEVPVALAKGRSNYVCLRKWEEAVEGADLATGPDEREFLLRTVPWLAQTDTADRAELGVLAAQEEYWRRIQSESVTCLGQRCRWYQRHCFAFRARRRARDARVLVVNHALLLSDLKAGGGVLPPYEHVIIDEAHHLESAATEHLGVALGQWDLAGSLLRLYRPSRGTAPGGVLPAVARRLREARPEVEELLRQVQEARERVDELFGLAGALALATGGGEEDGARSLRVTPAVRARPEWDTIRLAHENAGVALGRLAKGLRRLGEELEQLAGAGHGGLDSLRLEVAREEAVVRQAVRDLDTVLAQHGPEMVRWIEAQPPRSGGDRPAAVTLRAAPVHVGPLLRELLWDRVRSAVLTSATLTVGGRFDHVLERLGLDALPEGRLALAQVPSPFRYGEQALVLIPEDIPTPRAGEAEFQAAATRLLADLLVQVGGRTLVLFTSHRQLRQVYNELKGPLEAAGLVLLAQGLDGARGRLVEEFRAGERAVLMGSASFWEGVDIPGEDLSCVVVVRLPFQPPGDPVMEARSEDLEARGLSAFQHLSLPEAIIRFKQGFGRLIRTGTDRGVVVVLDRRIDPREARYGRQFLRSLPDPRVATAPADEIATLAARFLRDPPGTAAMHGEA
ncbi:helicase C-terminal domain-containing protein [Caldinitratiruptor microaerophilus]|uniref:3'-5' exonuclease DinG n=1 Tax=Caldinitratiruptor microaerophilus TaxID=671077 RepID=A0AA35CJ07_9FIRM|nr:helicase C-terminal domain-containing protein [Caldinitratiruptor microaerophilus]BDG60062.1 DNA polymerase III subunit epsilon [Caldinitratiruptor microaerophilus]